MKAYPTQTPAMAANSIGTLNGLGGELALDIVRKQGGTKTFSKRANSALLMALERLADDGYLESTAESAEEVTYRIVC